MTDKLEIGEIHDVGEFFWTDDYTPLGFTTDARHGHKLFLGGSAHVGDSVQILGFEGDLVVIKICKEGMPFGALCPHGLICMIPQDRIKAWPELVAKEFRAKKHRQALLAKYLGIMG